MLIGIGEQRAKVLHRFSASVESPQQPMGMDLNGRLGRSGAKHAGTKEPRVYPEVRYWSVPGSAVFAPGSTICLYSRA